MTQTIFSCGLECLEGVMLCEMPCLHVWFAQTSVKQNTGWAIWYYILSSSLKRRSGYKVLGLECVAVDTWQALDAYCVSDISWYLTSLWRIHHVLWVSADTWQVFDACIMCFGYQLILDKSLMHASCALGISWYLTSLWCMHHVLCISADTWQVFVTFCVCWCASCCSH